MKSIGELLEFGALIIDKPSGPTSFTVSDYVRSRLGVRKTSHMGTLDPGVTGVLPITVNRACKLSPYLINKEKEYVGIMRLHEDVTSSQLKEIVTKFIGTIMQKPPVRSNVKRVLRERTVFSFEILEHHQRDVLFKTNVEAGTYIRTLIHDMGKNMGGAHMLELRRTAAGIFKEKSAVTLYRFDAAVDALASGDEKPLRNLIIPADEIIRQTLPVIAIRSDRLSQIKTGKPIHQKDLVKARVSGEKGEVISIFCDDMFVEVAELVLDSEVIARPLFVLN